MNSIDHYQILNEMYRSEENVILSAIDTESKLPVVLKTVSAESSAQKNRTRLSHEYNIGKKFSSPKIIRYLNFKDDDFLPYLVLESIDGQSLQSYMSGQALDLDSFLGFALQILEALEHIHKEGIIHRDIKPSNIMVNNSDLSVKFIDFGLSSEFQHEVYENQRVVTGGTLTYISPEQTGRLNRTVDYRTDFYSLGITFYQMLSGKAPFITPNPAQLVHQHIAQLPRPLTDLRPELPEMLSRIVMKLLEKNPEDRYQSVFGILSDIDKVVRNPNESFELAQSDISYRLDVPQKLFGRSAELQTISKLFSEVKKGKFTGLLSVAGAPGIGKTSLVKSVRTPAHEANGYFLTGKCDHYASNKPYAVFVQAFKSLYNYLLTESDEMLRELRAELNSQLGSNSQILLDVFPDLNLILDEQSDVKELSISDRENRFNLIFQRFIRTICSQDKPIVLFLDDVQWIDSASLKLIQVMLQTQSLKGFLLILSYRSAEDSARVSLVESEIALAGKQDKVHREHINLDAFSESDVLDLVSESLNQPAESCRELSDLIFQKTLGNPFFVHQFLESFYKEKLLQFNFEKHCWFWDYAAIAAKNYTDNVVEFVSGKISTLSNQTQLVLAAMACVGNIVEIRLLEKIVGQSATDLAHLLTEAVNLGLIRPWEELNEFSSSSAEFTNSGFTFTHDRIRESAYQLADATLVREYHFTIAQYLLENGSFEDDITSLFDVCDQINQADILSKDVRDLLDRSAQLNLKAGIYAQNSNAYEQALSYFESARSYLPNNAWEADFNQTFEIHRHLAECIYLTGRKEEAQKMLDELADKAADKSQKFRVYTSVVGLSINSENYDSAINYSLKGLSIFGVNLKKESGDGDVLKQLLSMKAQLAFKKVEQLRSLPLLNDPDLLMVMELYKNLAPAAFLANKKNLWAVTIFSLVNLSIKHGNSDYSSLGYASAAIVIGPGMGDYIQAEKLGQLALDLLGSDLNAPVSGQIYFVVASFIKHWRSPLLDSVPLFDQGFERSIQSGDLMYAGYSLSLLMLYKFQAGMSFSRLLPDIQRAQEFSKRHQLKDSYLFTEILYNFLVEVGSQSKLDDYSSEFFQDYTREMEEGAEDSSATATFWYFHFKQILSYLDGKTSDAVLAGSKSHPRLDLVLGMRPTVNHAFFDSLSLLGFQSEGNNLDKAAQSRLKAHLKNLKTWTKFNPDNIGAFYKTVLAEQLRLKSKSEEAVSLLEDAFELAAKIQNNFLLAIISELIAKNYTALGRDQNAALYLNSSARYFAIWGHSKKSESLKSTLPVATLFASKSSSAMSIHTRSGSDSVAKNIDLESVINAAQTLSGEIEFDQLKKKLIHIIIENSGAQRCFFLQKVGGSEQLIVAGSGSYDSEQALVPDGIPLAEVTTMSRSIALSVSRSRETVLLSELDGFGEFEATGYISDHRPKSLLCMPVVSKNELKGIIYLENNITASAFTPSRLKILDMLSTQIAISFENAQLYEEMKTLNSELRQEIIERKKSEEERIKIESESQRKTLELKQARELQLAMLPESMPDVKNYEIAAISIPATEVGGDYYDYDQQSDGKFTIVNGDATGHGIKAGIMVSIIKALFSNRNPELAGNEVLSNMSRSIKNLNLGRINMCLTIANFDDSGVEISSAAMPPILVYKNKDKEVDENIIPGIPLGTLTNYQYSKTRIALQSGDALLMMSDGFAELLNGEGEEIGYENTADFFKEALSESSTQKSIDKLVAVAKKWSGHRPPDDDITFVLVRKK